MYILGYLYRVHKYINICTHIYMYIYMYICVYIYMYIHIYIYVYKCEPNTNIFLGKKPTIKDIVSI